MHLNTKDSDSANPRLGLTRQADHDVRRVCGLDVRVKLHSPGKRAHGCRGLLGMSRYTRHDEAWGLGTEKVMSRATGTAVHG